MKNKMSAFLSLGLIVALSGSVFAAARSGAKGKATINSSATAILACGAGQSVLYSVISSTGATSDYIVFRDSGTANTTSPQAFSVGLAATGTTQVTFDPPIQFTNGISVNAPATISGVTVTCESGRIGT